MASSSPDARLGFHEKKERQEQEEENQVEEEEEDELPLKPHLGSTTDTSKPKLSLKLLVDTQKQRVLCAEATKEIVDFLFSLLTLPLGKVVQILSKDSMAGSVGNLYGSVEKLDATYVCSADAKNALLAPAGGYRGGMLLQLPQAAASPAPVLYRCRSFRHEDCYKNVTNASGTICPGCYSKMTVEMKLIGPSVPSSAEAAAAMSALVGTGFVQGIVKYIVMDDLTVEAASTISSITLLNTLGITDIGMLQEKTVQLGYAEGLEILRLSLQSKTVLTDVFLGKKQ